VSVKTRLIWFSNTIDIWYTVDAGVAGTPVPAYGVPDGLVLRVVRNGLAPGTHDISVTVPPGKTEGSSFSHWNISGVQVGHN
jgi:hypothetical protein